MSRPSFPVLRRIARLGLASSVALCTLATLPAVATADVTCNLVVAASGADTATGGPEAPLATLQKLVNRLAPGETGCVRGTVVGESWIDTSGVTLTSEPGQRGRIIGPVTVGKDANNVTVRDLDLDASRLSYPSPIVLGDDALIAGNDITNDHAPMLCLIIGAKGHHSGARAERTRIENNRIHDCGTPDNHRHGIYVEHALDTRIIGNEIIDNADRGIQLYPDAQRTVIEGNIIDGNGQGIIFSGQGDSASGGTRVRYNVITNPRLRAGVESWYPEGTPLGVDNVVERNCLWGGRAQIDDSNGGFVARDNTIVDPQFVDRGGRDFRLQPGSPCRELLDAGRAGREAPAPAPAPVPVAAPPAPAVQPAPPSLQVWLTRPAGPAPVVTVQFRRKGRTASVPRARVELKYGGRPWRFVGVRRVPRGKKIRVRARVPRGAKGVSARVTLLHRDGRRVLKRASVTRARL